jgi:hypothetical protein
MPLGRLIFKKGSEMKMVISPIGQHQRVAAVRQTRVARACVVHEPSYKSDYALNTVFQRLDRKLLERNKYAPWGRGSAAFPDSANDGAVV